MADEIKLKAPTVEQQVVVNINGEEKLRSFADTLEKISNNKNLQKYWKTQQELINATADAYGNFSKKASQDNAKELIKVTNALKAMSSTDLSNILPDFDKISKAMAEAQKVAGNIDSAFSVKGFKEAFDSFETLKAYGVDIQNLFSHFGVSSDVGELQNNVRALEGEVEKLTRRLTNAKNANEELRNEFDNFKSGSGFADKLNELDNLKSEMSYLREQAEETFRQFLKLNNITEDGYDRDGFYDDNRFKEYFQNIQSGYMSASDAIRQFKTEYSYLLEDSFKSNNDTFGLEQLQAFSNKLDSIFRQVEETSTKINDIISNGVITKSVENLSMDSSLSDSQRSLFGNLLQDEESLKSITALFQKLIEESNKTSKVDLFNDEQLQQVLSIFDKMEGHLSSLRSIISDVGDGEEFSPLFKMINNVQSSISELTTSVKGIGLNMNIDVGSDSEMEAKVQSKIANALQAYQRLFEHIKMSSVGGQVITDKFFDFDINQYNTMMGKLQAYKKFIDNMRKEAKSQFNGQDILYQDTEKSYWTQASAAMGQVTKAFNEMNAVSDTNPLKDLFGSGDLSEVVSQLGLIVVKLEEISTTASSFKNVFDNGFNVTASVEEIDKLTNRVKELEDELSKIKLNPVGTDKSNISSGNETSNLQAQEKIYLKMASNADLVGKSHAEIKQLLMEEDKNGDTINKDLRDRILLLENGRVISEANAEIYKDAYQTESLLGKTQQEVLFILQKENAEIEAGNRLFRERMIYFKDGVVAQEILGDSMRVNGNYNKSVEADEFLHTHPIGKLNQLFSIEDMYGFYDEFSKGLKQFSVLSGNKLSKFNLSGLNFDSYDNFVNQYILLMQSVESQFKNFADKGAVPSDKFETVVNNFQRVISKYITDTFGNLGAEFRTFKVDGMGNISDSMPSPLTNKLRDTIFEVSKFLESVYDKIHQGELSVEEAEKQLDAFTAKKFQKTYSQDNKISSSTQIEDVFQGDDKVNTDASTTAIKEESQALEQASTSAKDAASSKEKFAKANKEVKASADSSKTSISEEEKYFNSLGKSLTQYQNTLTSISRKPANGNRSQELQEKIDIIFSSIEKLNALKSKTEENGYIFNKNDVDTGKQLEGIIKKNIELVKQMSSAQKGSDEDSRTKEIDKLTKYLDKNTRISKEAREQLEGYLALLKSGDPSVNVKEIHTAWTKVAVAEREAGREGKSFLDIFKNKIVYNYAAQLAGYFLSFTDIIRYARNAITAIREVDTALTELRKVSDATEQRLTTNFKNSADTAKELGATISDVISATADWSRMGYNIDQAEELARVSTLYKNVGDGIDIETANNSLISTLQGFQLDASEAESIIDKFNEVANNYAIDSAGIGEALQRSAASFNAANTDLSKSIALITATNEVVQDPDSVGTLWKTMSARIRGKIVPIYNENYSLCA